MVVKIRKKLYSPVAKDVKKGVALKTSLVQLSADQRQKELRQLDDSGPKVKVRFNVKGNQRGMHLAGDSDEMRKRRALRRLWNTRMPVLHCSNCQFSQQCPAFKAGYECAFNRFFNAHSIESEDDLIYYAKELATQGVKRAQRMLVAETLSGGSPSLETTEALSHVFGQLMQLHDRVTNNAEVEIEGDGSSSLISKLFGGLTGIMDSTRSAVSNPIHIPGTSAEALLEDTGASEVIPLGSDSPPRKFADPDLVRAYVGGGSSITQAGKPMVDERPL